MLIYTRCKMNHVDDASWDTPCRNTCYNIAKKVITEKGIHMDLCFATCKLRFVEIQGSVADIQVVFVEIQVNFNKH